MDCGEGEVVGSVSMNEGWSVPTPTGKIAHFYARRRKSKREGTLVSMCGQTSWVPGMRDLVLWYPGAPEYGEREIRNCKACESIMRWMAEQDAKTGF